MSWFFGMRQGKLDTLLMNLVYFQTGGFISESRSILKKLRTIFELIPEN